MFRTLVIQHGQRVIHLVDGTFRQVLAPGRHTVFTLTGSHEFVHLDVTKPIRISPADAAPDDLPGSRVIDVGVDERAGVSARGQFVAALEHGRWRWWEDLGEPQITRTDRRAPPVVLSGEDGIPANTPGTNVVTLAEPQVLSYAHRPHSVVMPGRYRLWNGDQWSFRALPQVFELAPVASPLVAGQIEVHVAQFERVAVLRGGAFVQVLGAGRWIGWEAAGPFELRRFDLRAEPEALSPDDPLPVGTRTEWTEAVGVPGAALVLVKDGQPDRVLPDGRYRAWTGSRWSLKQVPLNLQALDVAPQDLLTADEVPVRIKPAVSVRAADPLAVLRQPDWPNQVYMAVQLALREVVTGRALEALLTDRDALGAAFLERARALLPAIGLSLEVCAVKDVILPGEVKDLLNRVTLARKEAEALSIKRREETAATRQLANTARMLENNPVLMRLKELEALGEIAARIDKITLVGNGGDMVRTVLLSDLAKQA